MGDLAPGPGGVLTLSWEPEDPLAVGLALRPHQSHPDFRGGRWAVLVHTVRLAVDEPTGDGRVRFRPARQRDRVLLVLSDPAGILALELPRRQLLLFVSLVAPQLPWTDWQVRVALEEELETILHSGAG